MFTIKIIFATQSRDHKELKTNNKPYLRAVTLGLVVKERNSQSSGFEFESLHQVINRCIVN